MENFSFLFSSHMCVFQTVRQEKRKPLNRFFGEIGGIYSHLVAKSTPDAHISPGKKTTEPVYFQAGTLTSEKHCVQLLLGLSLHTHTTHTEHTLHRSSRQIQSVFLGEFFGRCWKPCTRLRPRHFNKDLKPHTQAHAGSPVLCSGPARRMPPLKAEVMCPGALTSTLQPGSEGCQTH